MTQKYIYKSIDKTQLFCLIFFLFFQLSLSMGQKIELDSMENMLNKTLPDTSRVSLLNNLSKKLLFASKYEKAFLYSKEAKGLSEIGIIESKNSKENYFFKKELANSHHYLGNYFIYKYDESQALTHYTKSYRIRCEIGDKKGIILSLNNISLVYSRKFDYANALNYGIKTLKVAEEIQDKNEIADSQLRIASVYAGMGDYSNALANALKALEGGKASSDKILMSKAYRRIGEIYRLQGNYVKALECSLSALKLSEEMNDEYAIRGALDNIGTLYKLLEKYDDALKYYYEVFNRSKKVGDKSGMAGSYNNIGLIYLIKGNSATNNIESKMHYKKSFECEFKAAGLFNSLRDKVGLGNSYSNIGNIYESLSDTIEVPFVDQELPNNFSTDNNSRAIEYYMRSLKIREEVGNKVNIANSNLNLGSIYLKKNNLDQSFKFLTEALRLSKESGVKIGVQKASLLLAELFEKKGDYLSALSSFKESVIYKDSLLNEDNLRQLNKLEIEFETEKKEKEIRLLILENQLNVSNYNKQKQLFIFTAIGILFILLTAFLLYNRKQIKQKFEVENRKIQIEKKLLESQKKALQLQMNPHFIFNSLNTIQDFIANFNKEEALKYISKFSKLIRKILENSSSDKVLISDEILLLYLYLDLEVLRHDKKFNYKIDVDPNLDVENIEIPSMIIQPFIENAILHGIINKKGKGHIAISLSKKDENILCIVEDDGIGQTRALEIKNKKQNNHKSMGIGITKERLNLLSHNSEKPTVISIIDLKNLNNLSSGTRVEIVIPIDYGY